MQGPYLRKYGAGTTVNFVLFDTDGVDFKTDAAHASGDTTIMKDEAAEANTTNAFADEGQGYSIALTAIEMEAARIVLYIADQSTKAWLDTTIVIETYGHASAQHAFDLDTATVNLSATTETQIDAIEADTNELQTDWADGGRLDLILDAASAPSAATVADAVWDEATTDHVASGSFGEEVQAHALSSEVATAAEVWAYGTRTLTQSAASVTAAVSGTDLSIHRGDSLSATITGLGDISGRTKLWFTLKDKLSDPDTAALAQIEETDGLLYSSGATATSGNGTLTVDDEVAGDVTFTLEAVEVAKLLPSNSLFYDIQMLDSDGLVSTLSAADAVVPADVTRAVA